MSGRAPATTAKLAPLVVAALMLLASALRVWKLGTRPLTSDELWNLHVIGRDWGDLLRLAATDTFPPLSYVVLKLWTGVAGAGDDALRVPAVAAGVACVPAMFLLGRTLVNRDTGLVAAGLLAVSGCWALQAQDARLYSLVTLCCLASWWAYASWRWEGRRRADLVRWWVVSWLGVLSHYLVWPLLLGQNLALWRERRSVPRSWWLAQALLVVAYVPWLLLLARPAARAAGYFADRPTSSPLFALRKFATALYTFAYGLGSRECKPHLVLGLALTAGLALLLWRGRASVPERLRACTLACVPVVLLVLVTGLRSQVPLERYLAAPAGGLVVLWLAWALLAHGSLPLRPLLLGAALGLNLVGALVLSGKTTFDVDFRPALRQLAGQVKAGDALLLDPPSAIAAVRRYLPAGTEQLLTCPPPEVYGHEELYRSYAERVLAGGGRVWLLGAPCDQGAKSWLDLHARLKRERRLQATHRAGPLVFELYQGKAD